RGAPPWYSDSGHRPPPGGNRGPEAPRSAMEGKWWNNSEVVRRLGLTNDQQRAIEEVFQRNRIKLIDLTASVEKEEAILEPLLAAEHPQESQVVAQIDRV